MSTPTPIFQVDPNFTRDWWKRCLADPEKLHAWLVKLRSVEVDGFIEHMAFMRNTSYMMSIREQAILTNIALDEKRHGLLLEALLFSRGACPPASPKCISTYWNEVLSEAKTPSAYYAANYFGERLAAERFEIILDIPETPSDIREVLQAVLPDEIFHRETLKRLAKPEDLALYEAKHQAALQKLVHK